MVFIHIIGIFVMVTLQWSRVPSKGLFIWPSPHTLGSLHTHSEPRGSRLSHGSGVLGDFAVALRTSTICLSSNTPAPLPQAGLPWGGGAVLDSLTPPGSPAPGGEGRHGLPNPSAQPAASQVA